MKAEQIGPLQLGARLGEEARFSVWAGQAEAMWLCLFDAQDRETDRIPLARGPDGVFSASVGGLAAGQRYGLRAQGPWRPEQGHRFDPLKLLVDPYATLIDRPYRWDPQLALPRDGAVDTAALVPKAVLEAPHPRLDARPPRFTPGGLIYEVAVRAFTMRHPDVPEAERGTLRALACPAIVEHLVALGVDAVELMPVTATLDERHLPALGLVNAWGYNPVTFMALDPRLAPGGIADLRAAVEALHEAGIDVILDLVFNHTAESDEHGGTLSLRGLGNAAYYRHAHGRLVNDTGCGNTLDCAHPMVQHLVLASLRHFVEQAGVDGFRFDLAPVLGRDGAGFDPDAPLLQAIRRDPILADRVTIAEPWDIGPHGYQLGRFRPPFLEWNDRFRDDVRRFWRGDGTLGPLATRLAGSFDIFSDDGTRSVNYVASHDGMTLADITAYRDRHNEANGEDNRDGHHDNLSWNNGVEGVSDDPAIVEARRRDVAALLATLFASRGTIMLTAGDEFGRTQGGNNNAYCQDNGITWLDWAGSDRGLQEWTRRLSRMRKRFSSLSAVDMLEGSAAGRWTDVSWTSAKGEPLHHAEWERAEQRFLVKILAVEDPHYSAIAIVVNGHGTSIPFRLPQHEHGSWDMLESFRAADEADIAPARSVTFHGFRRHGA